MKKITLFLLAIFILFAFTATEGFSLTRYVDTTTGQDLPSWGKTPDEPWKTIKYAVKQVNKIKAHWKITITVAPGTYNESVTIDVRPMSLKGTRADTIIDGGGQDVLTISGVQGVTIIGFTVQNGNKGIIGKVGAAFTIKNTTVQDNADEGIQVDENSTAQLTNCTVRRSGGDGIAVIRNSSVTCGGTIVSRNNVRGLNVQNNSHVNIPSDTVLTIRNNESFGFAVAGSSNAVIAGTVLVEDNRNFGVLVAVSSGVSFFDTAAVTVRGTTGTAYEEGTGIMIVDNSALNNFQGGSLVVENNTGAVGNGINVIRSSCVFLGNTEVRNNGGNGVNIIQHSSGHLNPGVEIHDNAYDGVMVGDNSHCFSYNIVAQYNGGCGIRADDGSSIIMFNSNVSNNVAGDIDLSFGSRSTLNGNTIGSISCDGTVLSRGDQVCP